MVDLLGALAEVGTQGPDFGLFEGDHVAALDSGFGILCLGRGPVVPNHDVLVDDVVAHCGVDLDVDVVSLFVGLLGFWVGCQMEWMTGS